MTENDPAPFAVIGATGQQGGAVVDRLLSHGAPIRAIVRDLRSDKSRALADRGVELVYADQDQPDSLSEAFEGVRGLFMMTTFDESSGGTDGETRRGAAMAAAAGRAGVPHVVYSSVGGAERHSGVPHFESKRLVEEALNGVLPASFIRPTFFMENLARTLIPSKDPELVLRFPMPGNICLQMVAVQDIGIVAAEVLLDPTLLPAGAIEIAGDQLTCDAIADRIGQHLGKPARFEELPIDALDGDLDRQAMFRWFVDTDSYAADFTATRHIDPDTLSLDTWLNLHSR